jgi:hypothetical protein
MMFSIWLNIGMMGKCSNYGSKPVSCKALASLRRSKLLQPSKKFLRGCVEGMARVARPVGMAYAGEPC